MTSPKSQLAFQLKTLFMGSDGTIPESYARTVEKKQLAAWIKEGQSKGPGFGAWGFDILLRLPQTPNHGPFPVQRKIQTGRTIEL